MARKDLVLDRLARRDISAIAFNFRKGHDLLRPLVSDGDYDAESRICPQAVIRTYRRYAPVYDWIFGDILQPGRHALAAAPATG